MNYGKSEEARYEKPENISSQDQRSIDLSSGNASMENQKINVKAAGPVATVTAAEEKNHRDYSTEKRT